MKFTNIALAGAAVGLAHASPVTKRAVSDGKISAILVQFWLSYTNLSI